MRPDYQNRRTKSRSLERKKLSVKTTRILVYKNLDLDGQYHFSNPKITIGRSQQADLNLSDSQIEYIQAIVHIQNENVIISDQGEKPGVFINGKAAKAAIIEPYDLVEIGRYDLKIEIIDVPKFQAHTNPESINSSKDAETFMPNSNFIPAHSSSTDKIPFVNKKGNKNLKPIKRPKINIENDEMLPDSFFELPPYPAVDLPTSEKDNIQEKISEEEQNDSIKSNFLPPFEPQKKKGLKTQNLTLGRSTPVDGSQKYNDECFNLPSDSIDQKEVSSKSTSPKVNSKQNKEPDNFAEEYFDFSAYRKELLELLEGKNLAESENKQKSNSDKHPQAHPFPTALTDSNAPLSKPDTNMDAEPPQKPTSKRSPEEDFILPSEQIDEKKSTTKLSKQPLIDLAGNDPNQLYNLIFSGALKPGLTLMKVKHNLNYQFGIDYRRLTRLIKGRQTVIRRNLSHKMVAKLYRAFDLSGAICSIVPVEELTKTDQSHKNKGSNLIVKDFLFQEPQKAAANDRPLRSLSEVNEVLNQSLKNVEKKTATSTLS